MVILSCDKKADLCRLDDDDTGDIYMWVERKEKQRSVV